jgi:hypothetical protein
MAVLLVAPLAACADLGQDEIVSAEALSTGTGLHADYFNNRTLTEPAALARVDATVNFNWAQGSPASGTIGADQFSVRWTGQVEALYTQTYTFYASSDDGVRLWVDGQQLINDWVNRSVAESRGTIALVAGRRYDIRAEYYENGGSAAMKLSWSSAGTPKQVIPQAQLYVPGAGGGTGGSGGAGAGGTGAGGSAGGPGAGGSTGAAGGRVIPTHCGTSLPPEAQPASVASPTTVVGTGAPASCTFAALNSAVTRGGVITFNCGAAPVTIAITATMNLPTNVDTVIDGGNRVTLDGQNAVRILSFNHGDFMVNNTRVTLQHLTLSNGKATPTQAIPTAPAPCSQGWNDGQGGALYMRDGNLSVIDCTFSHNNAAPLGPDTGGGAIYLLGSKNGMTIAGSIFTDNHASNAAAIGGLFATERIYDSTFQNNSATGNGANNNDPSRCAAMNNGQNEIGSGGNGGAIYQDGGNVTSVVLCGVGITNNAAGAGAFGGGVFMTSNDFTGTLTIQDSIITGNTGGYWTQVRQGSVTNLGTAFGVNALSATVSNSTLQGR